MKLGKWIDVQRAAIHMTRQHSRYLNRLLHREVPATTAEMAKALRHLRIGQTPIRLKASFLARSISKR